jgi:hypothetical protein
LLLVVAVVDLGRVAAAVGPAEFGLVQWMPPLPVIRFKLAMVARLVLQIRQTLAVRALTAAFLD